MNGDQNILTDPKFVYGVDVSTLPMMKLARAREHQAQLRSQIALWQASRPTIAELSLSSEDATCAIGTLRIRQPPPVSQWSLVFGDAIHNCRSALDAAMWAFAGLEGRTPPKPWKVEFRIDTDADRWDEFSAKFLSTVPKTVLERARMMQPFQLSESGKVSALRVLQKLSNDDKHRTLGIPRPVGLELRLAGRLKFVDDVDAERFGETPAEIVPDFTDGFVDGARVMTIRTHTEMESCDGEIEVVAEPHVEISRGMVLTMNDALEVAIRAAGDVLRVIADGLVEKDDPRADQSWKPLNVKPLSGSTLDEWQRS